MAFRDRYVLSHVTNHAPNKPMRTPISGLETADQNGISSLNEIVSRLAFATKRIVSMPPVYCSIRWQRSRVWRILERHFRGNQCLPSGMRTSWCPVD